MTSKRRSCGKKQRHETRTQAAAHLAALIHAGAAPFTRQVYKCRWCGGWHVGHRIGSRRRRH